MTPVQEKTKAINTHQGNLTPPPEINDTIKIKKTPNENHQAFLETKVIMLIMI